MASSQLIIFAIIATSIATYISRFMGALTSEKVSIKSKIFKWFNCVAYSTLAALLGRMVIFPAGVLADSDLLNKEMLIGLAIVNPIYFFCMMIGAMKNIAISISVILGTTLGPVIYLFSTEWSLLFAGLIAGTVAYLFGEKDGK